MERIETDVLILGAGVTGISLGYTEDNIKQNKKLLHKI
jgi:L-2-hydroxyglutarate oxidase LhgO